MVSSSPPHRGLAARWAGANIRGTELAHFATWLRGRNNDDQGMTLLEYGIGLAVISVVMAATLAGFVPGIMDLARDAIGL